MELIEEFFTPEKMLAKIKNQAGKYFKGVIGGSDIRKKIYTAKSFIELKSMLTDLY